MSGQALTHLDETGAASMVDIGSKLVTARVATAEGLVLMLPETLELLQSGAAKKGDVIAVARIAGIMGAKKTSELIPLCHPLMLDKVKVDIEVEPELPGLRIVAFASVSGKTGVEMEALTAVSITCLTIYDMLKAVDKSMTIASIRLLTKSGGQSGDWQAPEQSR
ncbi:cyclic pyranopterin monophosphate synthase MoaC [Aureimonas fodinaquatilis]|uniref:Cyclic pyranopterin monophosphate synthase n=1 Tax=Aureimonas fodinaquatilis TaxID=2565783 RepID=A0A5B0DWW0_9HYPH|nr:cyclic pyranopterin monophosphate synthase MoaC [Aureimonas fodinaquatilis]KAA0970482.1 cyclic pyranopterin monophosphate synthase MoaC [Aureimonas fodinaquatilis]